MFVVMRMDESHILRLPENPGSRNQCPASMLLHVVTGFSAPGRVCLSVYSDTLTQRENDGAPIGSAGEACAAGGRRTFQCKKAARPQRGRAARHGNGVRLLTPVMAIAVVPAAAEAAAV